MAPETALFTLLALAFLVSFGQGLFMLVRDLSHVLLHG